MLAMMAALPDAYWDDWLLTQFPNRTLEELDGIDWARLVRVLHVREIQRIEKSLPKFFKNEWKPSRAEWQMILRHNRLEKENG